MSKQQTASAASAEQKVVKILKEEPGFLQSARAVELEALALGTEARQLAPEAEYVDPYLFEIGHFTSREEYEELMRTAVIRPRSEVEFARPKRVRKR